MKNTIYLLIICIVGLYMTGCEIDPVEPENELQLDGNMAQLAASGWNANRLVSSGSEIEEVTQISQYLEEDGANGVPGVGSLKRQAVSLFNQTKLHSSSHKRLMKSMADSLFFFEDDSVNGVRKALYYNSDNGIARYYEVKYKFPAWRNIIYDSCEVRVDLNCTLEDTLDDILLNLHQLQRFKEKFFIQDIEADLKVTDWDGGEPVGVELVKNTGYRSNWFLRHLRQFIKLVPDKSGELREDFEYKDGKTSYKQVKFYTDNTGEFEEKKRNGTVVSGRFNSLEDDGEGSWEELTDYPEGRYIDKIQKSAQLWLTLPDSILTIKLVETKYFRTGKVNTDSARIITQEQSGVKNSTLHYYKHNGEHGTLHVVENEAGSTVEGNWTTVDDFYILLNAEYYIDGSGHIHFEAYTTEADYRNGVDPILVADYYFSPDGSGSGTLTYQGKKYELIFDESGEAKVALDDKSTTINLID